MCSAASQAGMALGVDGGRLAPLPPSAPWFGCHGLGAPVAGVSYRFGFVVPLCQGGACLSPPSCAGEGRRGSAGIQKSVFLHPFPPVLLFGFFSPESDLLMFKKLLIKIVHVVCLDTVPVSAGGDGYGRGL